ncbi:serpin family protein [Demequina lutea]|nr:serpin family protein [Demequina lutea]
MTAGIRRHSARRGVAALAAIGILGLTACASPGAAQRDPVVDRPAADASAASNLARSLNDAGFRIFHASLADGENTAVSPLSIGLAFGMLDAGATGQVADALDGLFAYPTTGDARLGAFNSLDLLASSGPAALPAPGKGEPVHAIVRVANRIFVDTNFAPLDGYRNDLARYFGAGAQTEPLATDGSKSAKDINAWIDKRTEGLIPTLVTPDAFNADSRLTLVNALYMKAQWQTPFEHDATYDEPFTLPDGSAVDVPTMHSGSQHGEVYQGEDFVAVALPYAYDELEMTLIVPSVGNYSDVEASLNQSMLDAIDAGASDTAYSLALPKFTTESTTDLRAVIEGGLGVTGLFGTVGLDGIGPKLLVSGAVHATKVIVDEDGTEAAAATAIMMGTTSAPADPPLEIRADHPFLYVIRDTDTGAVLFVGRVLDPR